VATKVFKKHRAEQENEGKTGGERLGQENGLFVPALKKKNHSKKAKKKKKKLKKNKKKTPVPLQRGCISGEKTQQGATRRKRVASVGTPNRIGGKRRSWGGGNGKKNAAKQDTKQENYR